MRADRIAKVRSDCQESGMAKRNGPSRATVVGASAYMGWTVEARTPQTVVAASAYIDWTLEARTPQTVVAASAYINGTEEARTPSADSGRGECIQGMD